MSLMESQLETECVCTYCVSCFTMKFLKICFQAFLVTGYLTIILYNFVLLGLLRLFEVLSNPMGHDAGKPIKYTLIYIFYITNI